MRRAGIQAATARVLSTTWQRCRVHVHRHALARAGTSRRALVSAFIATAFAPQHRAKGRSTNPVERRNGEIKRRTHVVGFFPTEAAIHRPVGPSRWADRARGPATIPRHDAGNARADLRRSSPQSSRRADGPGRCRHRPANGRDGSTGRDRARLRAAAFGGMERA
ncbi:hypothetical protein CCR85_13410 [Rhodothalassium salexigens]|nr:hypothetical protein [Rhodothalassium salexigens]MBK5919731.1 hypothetical protein [Rhodothalassium salexigens]